MCLCRQGPRVRHLRQRARRHRAVPAGQPPKPRLLSRDLEHKTKKPAGPTPPLNREDPLNPPTHRRRPRHSVIAQTPLPHPKSTNAHYTSGK